MYNTLQNFNNNFNKLMLEHDTPSLYTTYFEKVYGTSFMLQEEKPEDITYSKQLEEIFSKLPQPNPIQAMCELLSLFRDNSITTSDELKANEPARDLYFVCSMAVANKVAMSNRSSIKKSSKKSFVHTETEEKKIYNIHDLCCLVKELNCYENDDIVLIVTQRLVKRYKAIINAFINQFPKKKARVEAQLYNYIYKTSVSALIDSIKKFQVEFPDESDDKLYNKGTQEIRKTNKNYIFSDSLDVPVSQEDDSTTYKDMLMDDNLGPEENKVLKEYILDKLSEMKTPLHFLSFLGTQLHRSNVCIGYDVDRTHSGFQVLEQYLYEYNQLLEIFSYDELDGILAIYREKNNIPNTRKATINKLSLLCPKKQKKVDTDKSPASHPSK